MSFLPVILWTDALIFLLLTAMAAAGFYVRRQPHLLVAWRRVGESRSGMAALTVLLLFLLVGLADSLHYRPRLAQSAEAPAKAAAHSAYGVEVLSAFDALASGLRSRAERTYSAPLATHAYAKENLDRPDGTAYRDFPRLKHGGSHLADPATDWSGDVQRSVLRGLGLGLLAWVAMGWTLCVAFHVAAKVGGALHLVNAQRQ